MRRVAQTFHDLVAPPRCDLVAPPVKHEIEIIRRHPTASKPNLVLVDHLQHGLLNRPQPGVNGHDRGGCLWRYHVVEQRRDFPGVQVMRHHVETIIPAKVRILLFADKPRMDIAQVLAIHARRPHFRGLEVRVEEGRIPSLALLNRHV